MHKFLSALTMGTALLAAGHIQAALPDAIKAKYPGEIIEGSISLKVPELAENGSVVPLSIRKVTVPANRTVKEIAFYSGNNTRCPIASYKLTPAMLSEGLAARIKLASTTNIYAVATLDDGRVLAGEGKIKVTIGGCGGSNGQVPDFSQVDFCKQK
jgi:sulfur-oxidizing protein SoxY